MLPVYFEDRLVGRLDEADDGLAFAYDSAWRTAPDAFAISLTMPLRDEPFSPGIATPWFANLLPEEHQLELVGRRLGRAVSDTYGLLERMGRDLAGALSIGAPQPEGVAGYRPLNESELADVIARLPERPLLAGEEGITMSLAGAQAKLTVAVFGGQIALPVRGAASTHVLKPASDRLYATVENELLCMSLAAGIGIDVADVAMGVAKDRQYLMVRRYDRRISGPRKVARDHQEDFCQALGLAPAHKYEARRGPGLADLFRIVDAHARRPALDRLALLDLVIFGACIGDTDRHGKNYSLLLGGDGPRLAPGYDFMSSLAYAGITRNLAMAVAGQRRAEYLERRHWERFARGVRLAPAATVRRVETLATMTAERVTAVARELAATCPADKDALGLFAERIARRAAEVAASSRRGPAAEAES